VIELLAGRLPSWAATAAGVVAAIALAAGYVTDFRGHARDWDRGHAEAERIVETMKREVPRPAPGSTLYLFGQPGNTAPGVPIFAWVWDFNGAVKIAYDDPTLGGQPILPGATIACDRSAVYPDYAGGLMGPQLGSPYDAVFVHADGRWAAIDSMDACVRETPRFGGELTR
jgi:hypothetical protein